MDKNYQLTIRRRTEAGLYETRFALTIIEEKVQTRGLELNPTMVNSGLLTDLEFQANAGLATVTELPTVRVWVEETS